METTDTVYRHHLYELAGFKAVFGPEVVNDLIDGNSLLEGRTLLIPSIDMRLQGHPPHAPLSGLVTTDVGQNGTKLALEFMAPSDAVQIRFTLDFAQEELMFDVFNDLKVSDTGTAEGAEAVAEVRRFFLEYMANGRLQVFDSETGQLLSRKAAFIPINIMPNFDAAEAEIERWRAIAEQRRQGQAGPYFVRLNVTVDDTGLDKKVGQQPETDQLGAVVAKLSCRCGRPPPLESWCVRDAGLPVVLYR